MSDCSDCRPFSGPSGTHPSCSGAHDEGDTTTQTCQTAPTSPGKLSSDVRRAIAALTEHGYRLTRRCS